MDENQSEVFASPRADPNARCWGRVVEVASDLARVEFESTDAPLIGVGRGLELALRSSAFANERLAAVEVMRREDERDCRVYDFRAVDARDFADLPPLRRRRRTPRIQVGGLRATLCRIDGAALGAGDVCDLSLNGLCLLAPERVEGPLASLDSVLVRLEIPNVESVLPIQCFIRNRSLSPKGIRYGLAFDEAATPGFEAIEAYLRRFLMRERIEMLRRLSRDAASGGA